MSKQIEETLAPLVYSQLQDQVPELFKFNIGFQIIDIRDDGSKCFGILGFNINGTHYFMPIFYINGFLKPMIILYNFEKKQIIPATKEILAHIIKPKAGVGGKPVKDEIFKRIVSNPNFSNLIFSDIFVKNNSLKESLKKDFPKQALWNVLARDRKLLKKIAEEYPYLLPSENPKAPEIKKPEASLVIITESSPELTEDENDKIYRGGIVVRDNRKEHSKLLPSDLDQRFIWSNPTESGLYKLLSSNGFQVCWVLKSSSPQTIVIQKQEDGKYSYMDCKNEDLIGFRIKKGLLDLLLDCIPIEDIEEDKTYTLLNDKDLFVPPMAASGEFSFYSSCCCDLSITINPRSTQEITEIDHNRFIISRDLLALPVNLDYDFFSPCSWREFYDRLLKLDLIEELGTTDIIELIRDKGLTEEDAQKVAACGGNKWKYIKKMKKKATPIQYPIEETEVYRDPRTQTDNERTVDEDYLDPILSNRTIKDDIEFANSALAAGNDSIFDSALMGLLAKDENDIEKVKEMIPILNQAVHSLGTILFAIWWHPDSYQDEFSTDEIYEFEQNTLKVFKELGNITLTLMLKKKILL